MIRTIGLLGMAGGFVMISPNLRVEAGDALLQSAAYLNAHSPYSYLLFAGVAVAILTLLARSATAPR